MIVGELMALGFACSVSTAALSLARPTTTLPIGQDASVLWCEGVPVNAASLAGVDGGDTHTTQDILTIGYGMHMIEIDAPRRVADEMVKHKALGDRPALLFPPPTHCSTLGAKKTVPLAVLRRCPHFTASGRVKPNVEQEPLHWGETQGRSDGLEWVTGFLPSLVVRCAPATCPRWLFASLDRAWSWLLRFAWINTLGHCQPFLVDCHQYIRGLL
jgi:hypothetical protein